MQDPLLDCEADIRDFLAEHTTSQCPPLLAQAMEYAVSINAKQTYFTHMNQNIGFHEDINAKLPSHMQLAHDGLKVEFT